MRFQTITKKLPQGVKEKLESLKKGRKRKFPQFLKLKKNGNKKNIYKETLCIANKLQNVDVLKNTHVKKLM